MSKSCATEPMKSGSLAKRTFAVKLLVVVEPQCQKTNEDEKSMSL